MKSATVLMVLAFKAIIIVAVLFHFDIIGKGSLSAGATELGEAGGALAGSTVSAFKSTSKGFSSSKH
jgi:hypothetical protein